MKLAPVERSWSQYYEAFRHEEIEHVIRGRTHAMLAAHISALSSGWPDAERKRRLMELQADIAMTRRVVKALARAKKRLESPIDITSTIQRRAALAYELSQDPQWGLVYARLRQRRRSRASVRVPSRIEASHIQEWLHQWKQTAAFQECMANKCHPDRLDVDEFLLQSLVYEFIENQSSRGLLVSSKVVMAKYLHMWDYLEKTPCQTTRLANLKQSATLRKQWCRKFRRYWDLDWGQAPQGVNMTSAIMKRKAAGSSKAPSGSPRPSPAQPH